jgi:DNA repair protein RecO (recombination protein O)
MKFEDQAIILNQHKFQESSYIITLLTENHGLVKGLFRPTKKNKADMLSGNVVKINWNARLADHLGTITIESIQNIFTIVGQDQIKTTILNSALAMCQLFMQEREPQLTTYEQLKKLLKSLEHGVGQVKEYLLLELELLTKSGYGMDLSRCIATNEIDNLIYISPKSGGAVSEKAGEPYKDKMFKLPKFFLRSELEPSNDDIKESMKILGYFMDKFYFYPYNKKMPQARVKMLELVDC